MYESAVRTPNQNWAIFPGLLSPLQRPWQPVSSSGDQENRSHITRIRRPNYTALNLLPAVPWNLPWKPCSFTGRSFRIVCIRFRLLYLLSCIITQKSRIPSPVKFPLFWATAATILAGCKPSTQSPYLPSAPVWLVPSHRHSWIFPAVSLKYSVFRLMPDSGLWLASWLQPLPLQLLFPVSRKPWSTFPISMYTALPFSWFSCWYFQMPPSCSTSLPRHWVVSQVPLLNVS